jgi:hypothetical protein
MVRFSSASFIVFVITVNGVASRPSELFGSGVSQTGSKWPPYPGAGLDYWALQAGYYGPIADVLKAKNDDEAMPLKKMQVIQVGVPVKAVQRVPQFVQAFHPRPYMMVYG